ncbi:MAG: hypothetical protein KC620_13440, partial [Myxococcales bacterium]|nr:hypothetical protein [Myxococcales bacterium]
MNRASTSILCVASCLGLTLIMACEDTPQEPLPPDATPVDAMPGCAPGTLGCPCAAGQCQGEAVCDAVTDYCRAALPCACLQAQRCLEAPGQDAECLEECDPGFEWDATVGRCQVDRCHPDAPQSLAETCAAAHQLCEPPGRCGTCQSGYRAAPEGCVPVTDCTDLDCAVEHRGCVDEAGPPRCSACLAGFLDFGGECVPDTCALQTPGATATR